MEGVLPQITLGREIRSVCANGFTLREVAYRPQATLERHSHLHANISIVLDGSIVEEAERSTNAGSTGSVVFKPPTTVHRNHVGCRGARCLVIEVSPACLETLRESTRSLATYGWVHLGPVP